MKLQVKVVNVMLNYCDCNKLLAALRRRRRRRMVSIAILLFQSEIELVEDFVEL